MKLSNSSKITEGMTDKEILEVVKQHSDKYRVVVDNDSIWVEDIEEDEAVCYFSDFGEDFILTLCSFIGINADGC